MKIKQQIVEEKPPGGENNGFCEVKFSQAFSTSKQLIRILFNPLNNGEALKGLCSKKMSVIAVAERGDQSHQRWGEH